MGVKRKKTLKWIPNELLERVRRLSESRGCGENEMLRHALLLGIEVLEKEKNILEEIREIKERLRKLEEGTVLPAERKKGDKKKKKLVEDV